MMKSIEKKITLTAIVEEEKGAIYKYNGVGLQNESTQRGEKMNSNSLAKFLELISNGKQKSIA